MNRIIWASFFKRSSYYFISASSPKISIIKAVYLLNSFQILSYSQLLSCSIPRCSGQHHDRRHAGIYTYAHVCDYVHVYIYTCTHLHICKTPTTVCGKDGDIYIEVDYLYIYIFCCSGLKKTWLFLYTVIAEKKNGSSQHL